MGDNSDIEWTDATWNPVVGCSKVSPGCAHCYAETMGNRLRAMAIAKREAGEEPGRLRHYVDAVDNQGRWTGSLIPVPEAISEPMTWKKPRNVFVNSMSDLFHEDVRFEFIAKVFGVMSLAERHTFQVLTKRADRVIDFMTWLEASWPGLFPYGPADEEIDGNVVLQHLSDDDIGQEVSRDDFPPQWPIRNVIVGVSIEDQKRDSRFGAVCKLGEAGWRTMVSLEPLLGPVEIPARYLALGPMAWVIVGGESGPCARPMHPDWPKALRDQCVAAGVPFFFKQWGEWLPYQESGSPPLWDSERGDSIDSHCFPDCLIEGNPVGQWYAPELDGVVYRKVGKKRAGRLLDGREWNEMPRVGSEATAS